MKVPIYVIERKELADIVAFLYSDLFRKFPANKHKFLRVHVEDITRLLALGVLYSVTNFERIKKHKVLCELSEAGYIVDIEEYPEDTGGVV